jgi:hypothetical protein
MSVNVKRFLFTWTFKKGSFKWKENQKQGLFLASNETDKATNTSGVKYELQKENLSPIQICMDWWVHCTQRPVCVMLPNFTKQLLGWK